MQLHAAYAALSTVGLLLLLLLALLAFGFPAQECGATRITSPAYGSACGHSSEGGARQRPSPGRRAKPSSKQRTAARLCMDLYTHSATLLSRSLSFVANHPPPAHSRFPSKRGAALPSLLAPFFESLPLQTNKQQEEFSL
jgi:hypothetical protein